MDRARFAQRERGRLDENGGAHRPRRRAGDPRRRRRIGIVRDELSRARHASRLEAGAQGRTGRSFLRGKARPPARQHSRIDRRIRGHRGALQDRRRIPRHPDRAVHRDAHRPAPRSRAAPEGARRRDFGEEASARAWRRQPEEHPVRSGWAGAPGRRMRVVRRSGVRPRLLPQPSAAEMRVATWVRGCLPRLFRRDGGRIPRRSDLGAAGGRRGPGGAAAASLASWPRGRQVSRSST